MKGKFKTGSYGQIESLDGVAVGDKFIAVVRSAYHGETASVVNCEKITKTQCIIGGHRFRIADAFMFGESRRRTSSRHIREYSDAYMEQYRKAEAVAEARRKIRDFNWRSMSDEQILQVAAIVFGESQ